MRQIAYDKEQLERWYLSEHLTLEQIGQRLGITRQAAWNRIRRCRIDTSSAERFDIKCDVCGEEYSTTRKRYLKSIKHCCSHACYMQYLRSPEYKAWRQGQRIARINLGKHLGREVRTGEVVDFIDGDNRNNEISNLMLFPSSAEHIAYHHELKRKACST